MVAFERSCFHRVNGGGSKILLLRRVCCLWSWWVSSGLRRKQQNLASEASVLPLVLVSFIGFKSEASKSCFLRHVCCLCSWRVSWAQRQRQQILAPEASLLPLRLAGFMGSTAEAAKSCSRGEFAAFGLGGFHWVGDGGSKFLLPGRVCCLCAWRVSKRKDRNCRPKFGRQFLSYSPGCYLPHNIRILDLLVLREQQDL